MFLDGPHFFYSTTNRMILKREMTIPIVFLPTSAQNHAFLEQQSYGGKGLDENKSGKLYEESDKEKLKSFLSLS